jgi:ribonuclease HI
MVICKHDKQGQEGIDLDALSAPLLIRIVAIPEKLGVSEMDNDHAELLALAIAEETMPAETQVVLISDSSSMREKYIALHDNESLSERELLRQVMCKPSIHIRSRLKIAMDMWKNLLREAQHQETLLWKYF